MDAIVEAELLLAEKVSTEQEKELVSVFTAAGLRPRVRRPLTHRGTAELEWLVLAALPIHAFLSGLGTQVVEDLYASVKRMTGRAGKEAGKEEEDSETAEARPAPMILQDSSGLKIVLEADLPITAYEALATLDLGRFHVGPVHYDRAREVWRSELDEAKN